MRRSGRSKLFNRDKRLNKNETPFWRRWALRSVTEWHRQKDREPETRREVERLSPTVE